MLAGLWVFALPALASADEAPQVYQVELIVFSHITAKALNAEHWPIVPEAKPDLSNVTQLTLPADQAELDQEKATPFYVLLPEADFRMKREEKALERDSRYQPVLHIAWRQPITSKQASQPVHIYGGASYDNKASVLTLNKNATEPYETQQNWQVNGTFEISVQRYLTAAFDLQFAVPRDEILSLSDNDNFAGGDSSLVYFNLKQDRRMRSKELNYIDYPLYGALIKVIPVADEAATE